MNDKEMSSQTVSEKQTKARKQRNQITKSGENNTGSLIKEQRKNAKDCVDYLKNDYIQPADLEILI